MIYRRYSRIAAIVLAALLLMGAGPPACNQSKDATQEQIQLQQRAIRAIKTIPAIVRIAAPNLDPLKLAVIDAGVGTFTDFAENPTAEKWQIALNSWNERVRQLLLDLNKQGVTIAVLAVDIILPQVVFEITPAVATSGGPASMTSQARVVTKFNKKDIEKLELAVGLR